MRSIITVLFAFAMLSIVMPEVSAQRRDSDFRPLPVTIYATRSKPEPEPEKDRRSKENDSGSSGSNSRGGSSGSGSGRYSAPANYRPAAFGGVVEFSPGSPGQLVGAPGAFTQMILSNNAILKGSVRQIFANRASIGFLVKPTSAAGHHYLTLNSLGKFNMTVYQVMALINQNPGRIFPFFDAVGQRGQQVLNGNIYNLNFQKLGIQWASNPVQVTSTSRTSLTFSTLPDHYLQGTATHGVFVDLTGEMWLFQEGVGVAGETPELQQFNYAAANIMWGKMAENLKSLIDVTPKASVRGVQGKTTDGVHYKF